MCCLAATLLLLAACGGDEEPAAAAAPTEAPPAAEAPAEPASEPETPGNLAHVFAQGTELVSADEGGPLRNPVLAVTEDGFSWGALVRSGTGLVWMVDGEATPIEGGEVSEFTVSGDLSRYAHVSDGVVVVDGKQVEQGTTSCCPTFNRDGSRFGYIADGSVAVIDGVSQESHGATAAQLVLSLEGQGVAYIADGNTVVVDGEAQKAYDSVSTFTFSTDGSRFAYIADDSILVVDGEEREIGETLAEQIAFSPDGSSLAYIRGDFKAGRLFLDEKEQKRYRFGCTARLLPWACITFTSDGSGLGYTTQMLVRGSGAGGGIATSYRLVRDGVQDRLFVICCLVANPMGSQLAYVSDASGVVIDGQPQESTPVRPSPEKGAFAAGGNVGDLALARRNASDLGFSADGRSLGFLFYETDESPTSIAKLFLEILDVP